MKIIDCIQGSPEWFLARRGLPTASRFDRILTPRTRKPSTSQDDLIDELIAEVHALGVPDNAESYTSRAMQNGRDVEPEARLWYEMHVSRDVQQVGLCISDCGRWACSPDGLIGDDGGLELKVPMGKTHVKYLRAGGLPDEYKWQVHGALIVTGRAWWDFCSYSPGLPPFIVRVTPNEETELLRAELERFSAKYAEALRMVREGETK